MSAPEPRLAARELMEEIAVLAAERTHRLAPDMCGGRQLTLAAALGVRRHLDRCPVRGMSAGDLVQRPEPAPEVRKPMTDPQELAGRPRPMEFFSEIPDGCYAVPSATGNNDLDFFQLKTKKGGKYQGRRFVDRIVGGHENLVLGNMQGRTALEAVYAIGWAEAARLFSQEFKRCFTCPNSLTKYASRQLGMGRRCAEKVGRAAEWDEIEAQAPAGYYAGGENQDGD